MESIQRSYSQNELNRYQNGRRLETVTNVDQINRLLLTINAKLRAGSHDVFYTPDRF